MAGIDPSIPLNANRPQPVNPLTQMQQYAQTGNAQLQMAQARMAIMSKNALMQAYQNAPLDPATGLPDTRAVLNYLQQNNGGLAMPDAVKDAQIQGLQGYATRQADLSQSLNRNSAIAQFMAPVLALGDNATPGDVHDAISRAYNAGVPTDGVMASLQTQLPITDPDQFGNPAYRKQLGRDTHAFAQSLVLQGQAPSVGLDAATPKPAQINRGSSIIAPDMSPITNHGATSLNVPLTLSPGEATAPMAGPPDANGRPTLIPRGQFADRNGYGPNGSGTPSPVFGTGALPPALRNPANTPAAAPPAAPAAAQPGAPMPAAIGPGETVALTGRAQEGTSEFNALNAAAHDLPQQQAQLTAMLGDLTKYGSGPNSPFFSNVRGRLVQMGVLPESWAEGQSAQENFTKMANQFLAKQAGAMGPVTNDKIALSAESGPNPLFTSLGNQGVLHIAQGQADALNVKNQAALAAEDEARTSQKPFSYQQWSSQFNQSFAPSAFWFARMSPQERQTFVAGLKTPQEKAQFQKNVVHAIDNGWIDPAALGLKPAGG